VADTNDGTVEGEVFGIRKSERAKHEEGSHINVLSGTCRGFVEPAEFILVGHRA